MTGTALGVLVSSLFDEQPHAAKRAKVAHTVDRVGRCIRPQGYTRPRRPANPGRFFSAFERGRRTVESEEYAQVPAQRLPGVGARRALLAVEVHLVLRVAEACHREEHAVLE